MLESGKAEVSCFALRVLKRMKNWLVGHLAGEEEVSLVRESESAGGC